MNASTTEKMPPMLMAPIESLGVGAKQPAHPGREIRLRRFHDRVEMVAHQTIRMHLPARLGAGFSQRPQKLTPILVV